MRAGIGIAAPWLALLLTSGAAPARAADGQPHFETLGRAFDALFVAVRADETAPLVALFGPGSEPLVRSGDPVADASARERFLEAADRKLSLEQVEPGRVEFDIGTDDWPFPIPLVRDEQGWYFDAAEAQEEIINRRIGRNELTAIAVARAYVDAQREYAALEAAAAYAQKFLSSEGARDGLYWAAGPDEPASPMGPLVDAAVEEGYLGASAGEHPPYHGYHFRILTGQGVHAPGGARSYLEDGRLTGGFALLAWPAQFGASGIMSFLVNQQGIVFQKDLGPETAASAAAITVYDPDDGWEPVVDVEPES